ncbi:LGFP repeat-containing protein [Microbacterium sp. HJ5]
MTTLTGALIASAAVIIGLVAAPAATAAPDPSLAAGSPASTGIVAAADLSGFQPGNIISDGVFFNRSTMSEAQIQSFLQSKVKACQAGYTCLKDYYDTSRTTTSDAMCGAYSGGVRERASRIIYKVAQACGINPQVILVMLQKEQGLVASTAPSAYNYRAAMGQGCPDTAGCDTRYYGFFNQVYGGAWQMKRYANPPGTSQFFTWYAPGKTWNLLYHPNRACGSAPVAIQNQATANLYYYTPYQPNAAALRAGYGTGNSCSSYGNRNFYNYFTDWFGSTRGVDGRAKIAAAYNASGGASGPLGAQLATRSCAMGADRCWQDYQRGAIGWTEDAGAFLVTGAVWDRYRSAGGPPGSWGYPTSTQNPITSPTGNGSGQNFQNVQVLSSAAGVFAVANEALTTYAALGWVRGELGWPTSAEACRSGACAQATQNGWLGHTGSNSYAVTGDTAGLYRAAGGMNGSWGYPTSGRTALTTANGDGAGQNFERVQLLSSGAGTFAVPVNVIAVHAAAGWVRGDLGWPTASPQCSTATCVQAFQGGYVAGVNGSLHAVSGGIAAGYRTAGGPSGAWGYPTSAQSSLVGPNGSGTGQNFQRVQALSGPAGTFAVPSAILTDYASHGWVRGALGWPTAPAACDGTDCTQTFQSGVITRAGTVTRIVSGAIGAAYVAAGGVAGSWGAPTSSESSITGGATTGSGQNFKNVQALRSSAGAFAVPNTLLKAYAAAGWVRGTIGWPTAVAKCPSATSCSQDFQGGLVMASEGGVFAVGGSVATAYRAAGGAAGAWGVPTSAENPISSPRGAGFGQNFRNVQVLRSAAGTFAVPATTLPTYSAAGWVRGALGWPVSASTCDTTGSCVQGFQGGRIVVPAGGAPRVVLGKG